MSRSTSEAVVKEEEEWTSPWVLSPNRCRTLRNWINMIATDKDHVYARRRYLYPVVLMDPADLTGNKRGACGINQEGACGKIVLIACLMGTCAHSAHGRHSLPLVPGQVRRHEVRHGRRDPGVLPYTRPSWAPSQEPSRILARA